MSKLPSGQPLFFTGFIIFHLTLLNLTILSFCCLNTEAHKASSVGKPRILGLGTACIDYISNVRCYPKCDEKIRSTQFLISGGGNIANTLTVTSKLGVYSTLCTILGTDISGVTVSNELLSDGVDLSWVISTPDSLTGITQIIVDEETNSRTCIHNPMTKELTPEQLETLWKYKTVDCVTKPFDIIHFDSRQTLAGISLAELAIEAAVPTSIDIEKSRPHVDKLLPLCDIIFTNKNFPKMFSDSLSLKQPSIKLQPAEQQLVPTDSNINQVVNIKKIQNDFSEYFETIENMITLLDHNKKAKAVISTLAQAGSILVKSANSGDLERLITPPSTIPGDQLSNNLEEGGNQQVSLQATSLCISYSTRYPPIISLSSHALTAIPYSDETADDNLPPQQQQQYYEVIRCPAFPISKENIIDSTGAGDAFIGGFLSALLHHLDDESCLKVASKVACEKLKGMGARATLPTVEELFEVS